MWQDFINLFYPNYCLGCEKNLAQGEKWICTGCWIGLPQTNHHLTPQENRMIEKFYGRLTIAYGMAFLNFRTGGYSQRLVHQLKYGGQPELGIFLGQIYGTQLAQISWSNPFDLIVPIPIHPNRLEERGYNQSSVWGKGLGNILQLPCMDDCVARIKHTASQTRSNKAERLQKVKDAFSITKIHVLQGRHILLVDDVVTTGATLEACALTLLQADVKTISIATLAMVE